MRKRLLGLILANLVMMSLVVIQADAQEAKPETPPETKPPMSVDDIKKSLEEIKNYLGLSVYLEGGYTFNFRNPDSGTNEQRIFDQKANTFLLDLAQVQFSKDAPLGGVGYRLKVSAGETAKYIHAAGLGETNDAFDLTEAYIDYAAPIGSGLKLRFGKFATYHSAEVNNESEKEPPSGWEVKRLAAVASYDEPTNRGSRNNRGATKLSWHPDGRHLAYGYDRLQASGFNAVHLLDTESGKDSIIVKDALDPYFSPDGRFIVYWTYGDEQCGMGGICICAVTSDGKNRQKLVANGRDPTW